MSKPIKHAVRLSDYMEEDGSGRRENLRPSVRPVPMDAHHIEEGRGADPAAPSVREQPRKRYMPVCEGDDEGHGSSTPAVSGRLRATDRSQMVGRSGAGRSGYSRAGDYDPTGSGRTNPSGGGYSRSAGGYSNATHGAGRGASYSARGKGKSGDKSGTNRRTGYASEPVEVHTIEGIVPEGSGEIVRVTLLYPAEFVGEEPSAPAGDAFAYGADGDDLSGEETNPAFLSAIPVEEGPLEPAGRREEKRSRRVHIRILTDQYAELRLEVGAVSPETASRLEEAGALCEAIRLSMRLLQYGDLSARRLSFKLTSKGIDRPTAEAAAAYMADHGWIAEDSAAERRAEQDLRKLWGPRRIREDLRAQGYTSEAISAAMEALTDQMDEQGTDFAEQCALVIRRKYAPCPTERAAYAKMMAALMRLGYEADTVREAVRLVERED